MKRRKLGTLEVSEMGFGCMNASGNYGPAPGKNQGFGVIRAAHEKGVTLFNTAEFYGPYTNEGLVGGLRSLEAVPVDAKLSYFGFKCLSWNSQLNGGAGWTPNHAFGFTECGFEHFSFVLGKVSNERNRRHSCLRSDARKPGFIYKESLPLAQNHRPLDHVLQLADVARPIICVEEFHGLLVYISNLLARFLRVAVD